MKKVFVQGCAIMAFVLFCTGPAWAQLIDLAHSSPYSSGIQGTPSSASHGSMTGTPAPPASVSPSTSACRPMENSRQESLLQSAASVLFRGDRQGTAAEVYSVDPETLCVAVSGASETRIYPVFPEAAGHSLFSILSAREHASSPVTTPGIMFLGGICLIGLSGLGRRGASNPRTPDSSSLIKEEVTSSRSYALRERFGAEA